MATLGALTTRIIADISDLEKDGQRSVQIFDKVDKAARGVGKGTKEASAGVGQYNTGLVQLGFAMDDATQFQYGFSQGMRAVGNNLIPIITGLGLSASAIGILAVGIGAAQLVMTAFADDTKDAKDALKDLEEQAKVTAGVIRGELSAKGIEDLKALRDGVGTLVETFDALSKGISSSNAAQSRAFSGTLSAYAKENDLSRERVDLLREIVSGLDDEIFKQETLARVRRETGEVTEESVIATDAAVAATREFAFLIGNTVAPYQARWNESLEETSGQLEKLFFHASELRVSYRHMMETNAAWNDVLGSTIGAVGTLAYRIGETGNVLEEFGQIGVNAFRAIASQVAAALAQMALYRAAISGFGLLGMGSGGLVQPILNLLGNGLGSIFGRGSRVEAGVIPSGDIAIASTEGIQFQARYGL